MIKNFLTLSIRNILKSKLSSFISCGSLVLGVAFALSITKYTYEERQYDRYIPDVANKYRLTFEILNGADQSVQSATSPAPFASYFKDNRSEIESFVRYTNMRNCLINNPGRQSIISHKVALADNGLLSYFGISMLQGPEEIKGLDKAIISKSLAIKLFGKTSVIGESVELNGERPFEIQGVYEDFPATSSVSLDFIAPLDVMQEFRPDFYQKGENWGGYSFYTFFRLMDDANLQEFTASLNTLYFDRFEIDPNQLPSESFRFSVMNLADIHLNSILSSEPTPTVSSTRLALLDMLVMVILTIAWINFINIQTSRIPERLDELNVRKALGALDRDLGLMLFVEQLALNVIALIIGYFIVEYIFPGLLSMHFPTTGSVEFTRELLIIIGIGAFASSLYPAYYAVRMSLQAARSNDPKNSRSERFRNVLVGLQFAVTIFLLAYTYSINRQVQHMNNQNPGYDSNKVLVIKGPITQSENVRNDAEYFKNELSRLAGVETVSYSSMGPGLSEGWEGNMGTMNGERIFQTCKLTNVADDFFEVFDIELLSGTIPKFGSPTNEPRLIINHTAAKGYGWTPKEAIGQRVEYSSGSTIVGVVEDFHTIGFQNALKPTIFIIDPVFFTHTSYNHFLLNIEPKQLTSIIDKAEELYKTSFPDNPFDYSLADDLFQQQYQSEMNYNELFMTFSLLSICLGLAGLLGLTIYHAHQKRKEIGIRKVLGSNEMNIVTLFSKKYVLILVYSSILALPVSYFFIENWLEGFAFRITFSPLIILVPIVLLGFVVCLTVGLVVWRSSRVNPVEVLRDL